MKFRFADFTLSADIRELRHRNRRVHISPKAFELLRALVEGYPAAISKSDLHNRLWPDVFVTHGNLPLLINEIRRVLGDQADDPRFIRTVPRFGYAFQAEVEAMPETQISRDQRQSQSCSLIWATRILPLTTGTNILGREASIDVQLDVPGVSRRHARITIQKGKAIIEDLGSKNGTFVASQPVIGPMPLRDGDRIQLGPVALVFQTSRPIQPTETVTVPAGRPAS